MPATHTPISVHFSPQLCGVLDGAERDDSDRLQSAHPKRPHLRRGLLPARQDATRGEEPAAAADDEPAVRPEGVQRAEATARAAAATHALPRWWPGDRRRRERDAQEVSDLYSVMI